MKTIKRVCALLLALGLMMSLFTGCESLFQSDKYRSYEKLAEQVQNGREFTKSQVENAIGRPYAYEGRQDGADYMDAQVTWWKYETPDHTGYGWRLVVYFDSAGNVISSEFYAPPGG